MSDITFATSMQQLHLVRSAFDFGVKLPRSPIVLEGHAWVFPFEDVISVPFGRRIDQLVDHFKDTSLQAIASDLDPQDWLRRVGHLPAFSLEREVGGPSYLEHLWHTPAGHPGWEIVTGAYELAIVGSSRNWAVWGQGDWEIAILVAHRSFVPEESADSPMIRLDRYREAPRGVEEWIPPLDSSDIVELQHHFGMRG